MLATPAILHGQESPVMRPNIIDPATMLLAGPAGAGAAVAVHALWARPEASEKVAAIPHSPGCWVDPWAIPRVHPSLHPFRVKNVHSTESTHATIEFWSIFLN